MNILVGLGNPGRKYELNRHNVGYLFVDFVDNKLIKKNNLDFLKTGIYMNTSGNFVSELIKKRKLELRNLFIVHDDLDIPLGEFKMQFAKGPKVHNGIGSIETELGSKDFWRIRIGVDARDSANREEGEAYVLQDFSENELQILKKVFSTILDRLKNGQI